MNEEVEQISKNDYKLNYKVVSLPAVLMLEHNLSDALVKTLNDFLDKELKNQNKKSAGDTLVGQIHQGEQLKMDFNSDELKVFTNLVENLGVSYLKNFVKVTNSQIDSKTISMDKLWSVHSYAGDYNPIHDHGTKTSMGVSFTTWTKVPPQIKDDDNLDLRNASGAVDGYLNFIYGLNQYGDTEKLRPAQARYVKPEVG